ncbi:MAG: hypothetical protein KBF78_09170 [Fuscovulum sp.]|nr:hypothetical protein [Fuscovulum sp.]
MEHDRRIRRLRIEALDIRLDGVSPAVARQVAAALPAAVATEMTLGRNDPGQGDLVLAQGGAAEVTGALAREIAARLRAGQGEV